MIGSKLKWQALFKLATLPSDRLPAMCDTSLLVYPSSRVFCVCLLLFLAVCVAVEKRVSPEEWKKRNRNSRLSSYCCITDADPDKTALFQIDYRFDHIDVCDIINYHRND